MDILGQSALIVAVTAFSLAVTAVSRNLRNKLVLMYAMLCMTISAWALAFFLEKFLGGGFFYRVHLTLNLLLAPVGLLFIHALTRVQTRFTRWLYRFSLLYALVVTTLEWVGLGDVSVVRGLSFFGPSFLALDCLYLMLRDWLLKKDHAARTKISTVGLQRRVWIYIGALITLSVAAMDHLPWLGDIVPSIGNLLLCLYLFMISEAIIHQRLLNLGALLTRVMMFVFISLCLTLFYMVFVGWISDSPALFVLNSFIASSIILMLIEPIKKLGQLGIMTLLSVKYRALSDDLNEAKSQLVGVIDAPGLAQLTLQFLEKTLHCESATVFVLRSDGSKFKRIRGLRDEALLNREVLATHPLVEFFGQMRKRGETPVILDQYLLNEIDRSTSQGRREGYDLVHKGLMGLNANIVIPFMDETQVLGFVVVHSVMPPEPWGNSWGILPVIYPFFVQAARVLKNLDVYVRLREKDRLATLGEMAAGLAHEIRNPLGAIKGAAQLLEPQSQGNQTALLQVIVEEVNRLNKVVTQFLDYSRPLAKDMVAYDAGELLERTYALMANQPQAANGAPYRVELVPPSGGFSVLPKIHCVPEQLKQVLVNLTQNGIRSLTQAPPAAGGVLRLGAMLDRHPRDHGLEVVLFVEDNGKGIPRENLEKIFIPFFTTSAGGTGLGLPICSRIVESHGGRMDVVSEEGKSTRFSVHLPVSESNSV